MSVSLINVLAQAASASAQTMSQYQLQLIGNQMTAQLNQKIAQLQTQTNNPIVPALQAQANALSQKMTSYNTAESQMVANATPISDINQQLAAMSDAVNTGDSAAFDAALSQANTDVSILNVVTLLPGFQPDGVANLQYNGLGIEPSASYDLSTATGQAQATAAINAAQAVIDQVSAMTSQNENVAGSVSQALNGQITAINNQVNNLQQTATTNAANQITQLEQQTQTQYHLIELSFGNAGQASSFLQSFESSAAASGTGSIFSLLDDQVGSSAPSSSSSSAASSSSSSSSASSSSSQTGSSVSTIA